MSDEIQISQAASLASGNTQIGVQNNYNGISVEKATRIITQLFLDNFPKLAQKAAETAKQRADELINRIMQKIVENNIHDLSPFADPDVQYGFWEAQKDYARLGKREMLDTLSSLLAKRIAFDRQEYIKIVIDRAIVAAKYLNQQQLDYLSLLFFCKCVTLKEIHTIGDLVKILDQLEKIYAPCTYLGSSLLLSLGCLELNIGFISGILATRYGFAEEDVKAHFPKKFESLDSDYGPSHVGIVLAITNMDNNPHNIFHFELEEWLHF